MRSNLCLLRRLLGTVVASFAIVVSLLTFPSAVPWMIACWLSVHTVEIARGRAGGLPLAIVAAILLVKCPYWPAEVSVFVLLSTATFGLALVERVKRGNWRQRRGASAAVLWIAWGAVAWTWHDAAHRGGSCRFDPERPVVCLGDSLTASMPPDGGYPDVLATMLQVPVVNLGEPGITTGRAAERLPELIRVRPQVVVIELGGHDFLKGHGREQTEKSLTQIIEACRGAGASVVLVEIPRGLIRDPFAGLERELARRYDLELVSDTPIRAFALLSPMAPPGAWLDRKRQFSADGIHPNARGCRLLAGYVADTNVRINGPEILAGDDRP